MCAATLALGGLPSPTQALVWDGGVAGTGTGWLNAANWNPDATLGINDLAEFNTAGTATTLFVDRAAAGQLTNMGNTTEEQVGQILLSGGPSRVLTVAAIASNPTAFQLTINGIGGTLISNTSASSALTFNASNTASVTETLTISLPSTGGDINVTNSAASISILGTLAGNASGTLNKTGAGTLTLSGTNTFGGAISISEGVLSTGTIGVPALGSGSGTLTLGAAATNGTLKTISAGGTISRPIAISAGGGTFDIGTGVTASGPISGSGTLTKSGLSTLTITGTGNTFNGPVSISNGALAVDNIADTGIAQALGTGASAITLGSATAGTFRYTGAGPGSTNRAFVLGGAGGGIIDSTVSTLTLTGGIDTTASGHGLSFTGGTVVISGTGISGSGSVTKNGSVAVLSLQADNTFTGGMTVNAGTVNVAGAGGAISASSGITLNQGGTLKLDNTVNSNDRLGGSTFMSMNGGTFEFAGDTDAATAESTGQLRIAGNASTVKTSVATGSGPSAAITFSDLARTAPATVNFDLASGVDVQFASAPPNGTIGGFATLNTTDWAAYTGGNGRIAAATYADDDYSAATVDTNVTTGVAPAGFTVNTLRFNAAGATTLTMSGANTLASGGILVTPNVGANATTITGGSLTGGNSEVVIQQHNTGGSLTVASDIVGSGVALTKSGSGTLILDSASNSYTGNTTIHQGTVQLSATGVLPSASAVSVNNGATLDISSASKTIGSLTGAGTVTLGASTLSTGANNSSTTYSGTITGTGMLTKVGTGTFTLNGTNSHSGGTNVGDSSGAAAGVLSINADNRLGAAPGSSTLNNINIYNGTFRAENGIQVTSIARSVPVGTVGVIVNINRGTTIRDANAKFDVPTGQYLEYRPNITSSGAFPLYKTGGGILDTVTATNTYTGGTIVTGGTLAFTADKALGTDPSPGSPTVNNHSILLDGGALHVYSNVTAQFDIAATRSINIGPGGGTFVIANSSGTNRLRANLWGSGTATKAGPRAWTVTSNSAATFTGNWNVNESRLLIETSGTDNLGTGTITLNGNSVGPVGLGTSVAGTTVVLNNPITLNPGVGSTDFAVATTTGSLTLNGVIGGTGPLTVNNGTLSSILQLGGNNTYSGGTDVTLGILQLGASGVIPDASAVNLSVANATLNVNNFSETVGSLAGAGQVQLGTGALTAGGNNNSTTYSGVMSGAGGSFTKTGAGTLTLSGANSYTGGTNVQAGTLQVRRMHENNAVNIAAGAKLQVLDSSPTLPNHPSGDNAFVSRPSSLTIAAGGQLDLGNNDLIIDYAGDSPAAAIEALVASGFNGGEWNGDGIISTTALNDPNFVLAVAENASLLIPFGDGVGDDPLFAGQVVDDTTVLVKFTHRVDLDLDGLITGNDAAVFNAFFSEGQPATWQFGDLDYDGVYSGNDAAIFNGFYNESLASVPEPAAVGVLGLAAAGLLGWRSRRR